MKAFRGTLIAAVLLLVLGIAVYVLRPSVAPQVEGEVRLFTFEKQELVRVEVTRPDGSTVVLAESDGKWMIEGTDFVAGRSMVNRVKHQIHDLTSRATVVENPDQPELYGLGDNAIRVKLTLRDGRTLEFLAGDPNPSSVSYYIQPLPGSVIYTVKKSAVDYYSLTLDEFRERRFAGFDSKDVTGVDITLDVLHGAADPGGKEGPKYANPKGRVVVELVGEREWDMSEPVEMAANDDRIRRLLGRVSALKAKDFVELGDDVRPEQLAEYGLDHPRADIIIKFASREPLEVLVGDDAESENKLEELAWFMLAGDDTVYKAKSGMLEEYAQDPMELRNRRVVRMKATDVVAVDAWLKPDAETDEDLEGTGSVRYAADQWVWKDGVPVPGSTPERVAKALAELEVAAFVDDQPKNLETYGLDDPIARAVLTDGEGNERVVLVGGLGEALVDPEGHERDRRYVSIEGDPSVYLVEDRVLGVIEDLVRESNRKAKRDAEKALRREKIHGEGAEEGVEEGAEPGIEELGP